MNTFNGTVRELEAGEVDLVIDYFTSASPEFLAGMGADVRKLPEKAEWRKIILDDLEKPLKKRNFYYLIWELGGKPVGHSNINKIIFGKEAYMHLHLWNPDKRQKGLGRLFVERTLPYYFEKFELEELFCEPYALNPGPNKVLEKTGFEFVKQYETIPGWINFYQTVNRWVIKREKLA